MSWGDQFGLDDHGVDAPASSVLPKRFRGQPDDWRVIHLVAAIRFQSHGADFRFLLLRDSFFDGLVTGRRTTGLVSGRAGCAGSSQEDRLGLRYLDRHPRRRDLCAPDLDGLFSFSR